jgi:hypothetical protein
MHYINISLSDKERVQIRQLKKKKGLTWRGVLIDWYSKNK